MKNIIKIITCTLMLFCGYAHADKDPATNDVCFSKSIESVTLLKYSVTPNQFFNPNLQIITLSSSTISNNCIRIFAGRNSDISSKNWVKSGLLNESIAWSADNMTSTYGYASIPNKLNFAVYLNLTLSNGISCNKIYIGQGSTGTIITRYNWWLFSNNNFQNHSITCNNSNNKDFTLTVSNSGTINSFNLQ